MNAFFFGGECGQQQEVQMLAVSSSLPGSSTLNTSQHEVDIGVELQVSHCKLNICDQSM